MRGAPILFGECQIDDFFVFRCKAKMKILSAILFLACIPSATFAACPSGTLPIEALDIGEEFGLLCMIDSGNIEAEATEITEDGSIIVGTTFGGDKKVFFWSVDSGFVVFDEILGSPSHVATSVRGDAQKFFIDGVIEMDVAMSYWPHWPEEGLDGENGRRFTILATKSGSSYKYDVIADEDGVIFGRAPFYSAGQAQGKAVVWVNGQQGTLEESCDVRLNCGSIALDVSRNGIAVGAVQISRDPYSPRASYWEPDGTLQVIDNVPASLGCSSRAFAISDNGELIVGTTTCHGNRDGFVWSTESGFSLLPNNNNIVDFSNFSGRYESSALAVSGNGNSIGGYLGDRAVIWRRNAGIFREFEVLEIAGPQYRITALSETGKVGTGFYSERSSNLYRSFIWFDTELEN